MKKSIVMLGIMLLLTGCVAESQDETIWTPDTQVVTEVTVQTDTVETEATHMVSIIPLETAEVDETVAATEAVTVPATSAPEQYLGICDICGQPYQFGEGFESLCITCQELYGPKCSVCGTDCTYRGTIDGMCDECWSASQDTCFWCGIGCGMNGQWVDGYYVCSVCGAPRPCQNCGAYYYFWEMFEGVCYVCDDPSDGAADGSA